MQVPLLPYSASQLCLLLPSFAAAAGLVARSFACLLACLLACLSVCLLASCCCCCCCCCCWQMQGHGAEEQHSCDLLPCLAHAPSGVWVFTHSLRSPSQAFNAQHGHHAGSSKRQEQKQ
mmetsp:Transcript_73399/g.118418  ORF Transcript_73399/g.118418 Transcript_73399/m.118418 type:complete len:119 (-) Transcript_73399:104-460(-)